MKIALVKIFLFILIVFSGYVLHALFTVPALTYIKDCPITSVHRIKLCTQSRGYVSLDKVSNIALESILAAEDINFYNHHGFDFYEMITALKKNIWYLKYARGGSTISQQVVKNVFLSAKKSFYRKIQEAYLTLQLEAALNKRQILELYINFIELGPNIFGIKQASEFYFHKKPSDLTILESAYLAHLLPNPLEYSQTFERQKLTPFSRSRILAICRTLWKLGYISAAQYVASKQQVDDFPWPIQG